MDSFIERTALVQYCPQLEWITDSIGQEGPAQLEFAGLSGERVVLTLAEAFFLLPLINARGQVRITRTCAVAAEHGHLAPADLAAWQSWIRTKN